jgi:anti-anti-sigma regulatory factor
MSFAGFEAGHTRLVRGMEFIQLMTRTFSSLHLSDRRAIADTLSALSGSFLDTRVRFTLLAGREDGELGVAASEGLGEVELVSAEARELWAWVMREQVPCALEPEALLARWPQAPAALRGGLACVAISLHDELLGVLAVADKRSREPFNQEELTFLGVASGLGSMAIANARAYEELDEQRRVAEARAEEAAVEARAKHAALVELDAKLAVIERQQREIDELSTPMLQLRAGVLVVPVIGVVDAARGRDIQERLMAEIVRRGASFVILDITGVELVDSHTADQFLRIGRCARLLGASCVVTGVRPAVARTLVGLDAPLTGLITAGTLEDGVALCLDRLANRSKNISKIK